MLNVFEVRNSLDNATTLSCQAVNWRKCQKESVHATHFLSVSF